VYLIEMLELYVYDSSNFRAEHVFDLIPREPSLSLFFPNTSLFLPQ
jgi:hypothetical protein